MEKFEAKVSVDSNEKRVVEQEAAAETADQNNSNNEVTLAEGPSTAVADLQQSPSSPSANIEKSFTCNLDDNRIESQEPESTKSIEKSFEINKKEINTITESIIETGATLFKASTAIDSLKLVNEYTDSLSNNGNNGNNINNNGSSSSNSNSNSFHSRRYKMADVCGKCKKLLHAKDLFISCACQRRYHRVCVNIDDNLYDVILKNPMIVFSCDDCRQNQMTNKTFNMKLQTIDEKLNKLNNGINQIHGRMYQQYFQFGNMNNSQLDAKKQTNSLIVVGNNCNTDRLQVVCDYGRWVQVGKFATCTSEDDVIEHLAQELKINKNLVKCTKLVKNDANLAALSYCKFKISIPDYRFNELFNEAIWPSGVMVSPFTPRSQLNQNRI